MKVRQMLFLAAVVTVGCGNAEQPLRDAASDAPDTLDTSSDVGLDSTLEDAAPRIDAPRDTGASRGVPGLVFASEWNTTTGTTDEAVLDLGRTRSWTELSGAPEVRRSAEDGFAFPTDNYLLVPNTRVEIRLVPARGGDFIPLVSVGESIHVRFYIRGSFMYEGPGEAGSHGIYFDDDQTMGNNWGPNVLGYVIDSSLAEAFRLGVSRTNDPYDFSSEDKLFFPPGNFDNGVVYRIETRYSLETESTYTLAMRVFEGESTTPLYDSDDFIGRDYGATLREQTFAHLNIDSLGPNGMQGMVVGVEEPQPGSGDLYSIAALAITAGPDADWIGPYTSLEASFSE